MLDNYKLPTKKKARKRLGETALSIVHSMEHIDDIAAQKQLLTDMLILFLYDPTELHDHEAKDLALSWYIEMNRILEDITHLRNEITSFEQAYKD